MDAENRDALLDRAFDPQRAPSALLTFLLSSAMKPSQPLMCCRHCVFHELSHGCLTDMSV